MGDMALLLIGAARLTATPICATPNCSRRNCEPCQDRGRVAAYNVHDLRSFVEDNKWLFASE